MLRLRRQFPRRPHSFPVGRRQGQAEPLHEEENAGGAQRQGAGGAAQSGERQPRRCPNCSKQHDGPCKEPRKEFTDRTCWTCGGKHMNNDCHKKGQSPIKAIEDAPAAAAGAAFFGKALASVTPAPSKSTKATSRPRPRPQGAMFGDFIPPPTSNTFGLLCGSVTDPAMDFQPPPPAAHPTARPARALRPSLSHGPLPSCACCPAAAPTHTTMSTQKSATTGEFWNDERVAEINQLMGAEALAQKSVSPVYLPSEGGQCLEFVRQRMQETKERNE